jgi:aerobic-type carbon monoxide dehydrogenase small subunit (CoxS/CutS family)
MPKYTLKIDGASKEVDVPGDQPLLYTLTDQLKMKGPRFGCGLAQCGTCTVILNDQAVRSCVTPTSVAAAPNAKIRTLDGLAQGDKLHPMQTAFIEEQAAQCGYCANGWIMQSIALLEKNPRATDEQIINGLDNLQCRCGTQLAILRAVKKARETMKA